MASLDEQISEEGFGSREEFARHVLRDELAENAIDLATLGAFQHRYVTLLWFVNMTDEQAYRLHQAAREIVYDKS